MSDAPDPTPHFSIRRRVQFAETDMAGIVHFSNYFRWMEEVEHAFFRSRGLSVAMTHENVQIGWPRVNVGCEYYGPVRFEDELELRLRITKVGGKSLCYEVDFLLGDKLVALGKSTSVCCEHTPTGLKAIGIPAPIRDKLTGGRHDIA
jgi:YbgC/YbaW family acyl-CoA thioester hydrolase